MSIAQEIVTATALAQATSRYLKDLELAAMWQASKGSTPSADHACAVAVDRVAETYAGLLRAALDLFEDGDLFDKWQAACADAGIEVRS